MDKRLPPDGGLGLLRGLLAKRPEPEPLTFFAIPVAQHVKDLTADEVMKLMAWRAEIAAGEAARREHSACVTREFEALALAHDLVGRRRGV